MSTVELQIDIENQTHKYKQNRIIREYFNKDVFLNRMAEMEIPIKYGLNFLVQMSLHRRASFEVLFGVMYPYTPNKGDAQQNADLISTMLVAGFVDYDQMSQDFVCAFNIPSELRDKIDSLQYPIPLVTPPKKVRHNKESGYYTEDSSIILKNYNYHDGDVNLDLINRSNIIKYTLNNDVANMVKNHWKGLDKKKPDELVNKYIDRVASFIRYDCHSREVMELINMSGNEFYFTHRYDKRGRKYCQGYHINYQGNPWNKSVIEFANKEVVV